MQKARVAGVVVCCAMTLSPEVRAQYSHFLDGSVLPQDAGQGWVVDTDAGLLVDLGGGNFGMQQTDNNDGGNAGISGQSYDEWYIAHGNASSTMATRFRVDANTSQTLTLLALTPGGDGPGIGVGIMNGNFHLTRFLAGVSLLDLGLVNVGTFNEALIHIDSDTDLVRFSWNGTEVYNAVTDADYNFGGGTGYAEFGASNYWAEGGDGSSTVTYDWLGYGPGYIPEPGSLGLFVLAGLPLLRRRG